MEENLTESGGIPREGILRNPGLFRERVADGIWDYSVRGNHARIRVIPRDRIQRNQR